MAIAASGAVSFSDLRTEFVGGSGAISYSDLYRGGSNIRAKAANNTGVNLAASVPTSGTINFTNFRSQAKGFRFTYTTTSTDQDADTLFGSDYAVNYPKEIVINSGVTIGGVSDDALDIPSTLAGTLVINNNGSIIGKGGAANGGAGGHAINNAASNVTINNAGSLLAGGGGGGSGGTGGGGQFSSTSDSGFIYSSASNWTTFTSGGANGKSIVRFDNSNISGNQPQNISSPYSNGGKTYTKGTYHNSPSDDRDAFRIRRVFTSTTNTNGGSGGSGGRGQGYNQTLASGSSGASGGTNAGTGGSGASGAAYGVAGSSGSSGANGNRTNGSSGSSGGAAGAAVLGTSVTMNNTGTLAGAVA
jgi:hypothetical protein